MPLCVLIVVYLNENILSLSLCSSSQYACSNRIICHSRSKSSSLRGGTLSWSGHRPTAYIVALFADLSISSRVGDNLIIFFSMTSLISSWLRTHQIPFLLFSYIRMFQALYIRQFFLYSFYIVLSSGLKTLCYGNWLCIIFLCCDVSLCVVLSPFIRYFAMCIHIQICVWCVWCEFSIYVQKLLLQERVLFAHIYFYSSSYCSLSCFSALRAFFGNVPQYLHDRIRFDLYLYFLDLK